MSRCCDVECKPLADFAQLVKPMVPAAPDNLIEQYIRQALIELAYKTLTLQRDYYIDLQEGVQDYSLPIEDGMYPHMIREVVHDGHRLTPYTRPPASGCSMPNGFYFEQPATILLGRAPDQDCREALLVRAAVVPSQETCCVDKWLYDRYLNEIVTGALSYLMIMPGSPWFSQSQGGINLRRWKGMLANIKVERHKGNITGPTMMKVRRFI